MNRFTLDARLFTGIRGFAIAAAARCYESMSSRTVSLAPTGCDLTRLRTETLCDATEKQVSNTRVSSISYLASCTPSQTRRWSRTPPRREVLHEHMVWQCAKCEMRNNHNRGERKETEKHDEMRWEHHESQDLFHPNMGEISCQHGLR